MARSRRLKVLGGIHHITLRGNDRQLIFMDDQDRRRYMNELDRHCRDWSCDLIAYALMPNHVHLVLQDHHASLSCLMQMLNARYTRYFNVRHHRVGHLYQGRFHNKLVDQDSYLLEVTRYVHLNPVRAGLAARPEDYPWSSYRVYIGVPSSEEPAVHPELVWALAGTNASVPAQRYREFVESLTPDQFPADEQRLHRLRLVSDTFPALRSV